MRDDSRLKESTKQRLVSTMILFYWIKCGNCGRVSTGTSYADAIGEYVDHLNTGTHRNIHGPQAGVVEEFHG